MGNMELCCPMDQYEPLYPYLYAGKFIDQWRYELVAGNTHHFPGQYNCIDPNDIEWSCRREVWYTLPCICKGQLWNKRSKCTCHASCYYGLWMVWYPDMDRWQSSLLPHKSVEPFIT